MKKLIPDPIKMKGTKIHSFLDSNAKYIQEAPPPEYLSWEKLCKEYRDRPIKNVNDRFVGLKINEEKRTECIDQALLKR